MRSLDQIIHDINKTTYKLDTSGVAGLLGGENAVNALETIHLYEGRRWAGWYNYPGTVTVAKKFGQMANSRVWDSMFPGTNDSPAITFGLAGKSGPEYSGSFSGTKLRTGYLGYLMAEECLRTDSPCNRLQLFKSDGTPARETRSSATVTVITLPRGQYRKITGGASGEQELIPINPKPKCKPPLAFWSIAPSLVSIAACILCFIGHDSLGASLIILGIFGSGLSSLVLGTAMLGIRVPEPSKASPPGDGLMTLDDGSAIILKGEEADVNIVSKGEFELDYSKGILHDEKHNMIGLSSSLLYVQFLVQLLLTPRCTFFGQILFLVSFVASGVYHLYVASYEKESVHRELLSQVLSMQMEKWRLGTRTQMAVFLCLLLADGHPEPLKSNSDAVLCRILPNVNETAAWRYWRKKVLKELERYWDPVSPYPDDPPIRVNPEDKTEAAEHDQFTTKDKKLLDDLIGDAWCIFKGYRGWRDGETKIWQNKSDGAEEKLKLLSGGSPV